MSLYFQGVLLVENEETVRSAFDSVDSFLWLRLTRLSDSVFGIYPVVAKGRSERAQQELCRIAASLSEIAGKALWFSWDSCISHWTRLFENGLMTREANPLDEFQDISREGKKALQAVGVPEPHIKLVDRERISLGYFRLVGRKPFCLVDKSRHSPAPHPATSVQIDASWLAP